MSHKLIQALGAHVKVVDGLLDNLDGFLADGLALLEAGHQQLVLVALHQVIHLLLICFQVLLHLQARMS